ncbi:MAG: hypothetical protein AAFZ63_29395, partial [Bacteroidota bacterium]
QEVFPEMVGDVQLNGATYLDANLSSLPVYLVKAMQEQQVLIDELMVVHQVQKEKIASQSKNLQQQQEQIEVLQKQVARIDQLGAMLQQLQDQNLAPAPSSISSNN